MNDRDRTTSRLEHAIGELPWRRPSRTLDARIHAELTGGGDTARMPAAIIAGSIADKRARTFGLRRIEWARLAAVIAIGCGAVFVGQLQPGIGTPDHTTLATTRPCMCTFDLDGDCSVERHDLQILLAGWGAPCDGCNADLNGDGCVDQTDLDLLLGQWGCGAL